MHARILRGIISTAILLLLVIGCSSQKPNQTPVSNDLPAVTGGEKQDAGDITRGLMLDYDRHTYSIASSTTFSANGTDDYDSCLNDCIAATYYYDGTYRYNYVLQCDTKNKIEDFSTSVVGCIYQVSTANVPSITNRATVPDAYIFDPDACELAVVGSYLYAWIADDATNNIELYRWTITASTGALSSETHIKTFTSVGGIQGLAVTVTTDNTHYHLFACNISDKYVYVYDHDNIGSAYLQRLTGDEDGDIPIDACVTRYDGSTNYWDLYVAFRDASDRTSDYLECYHFDGTNYNTKSRCDDGDGTPETYDNFPYVIGLDVQKSGIESGDPGGVAIQHNSGCVAVFMVDTDFIGYHVRQVNFGGTSSDYYKFSEDFDQEINPAGIYPSAFGVCQMYYPAGGGNSYKGYQYIFGDRNFDLTNVNNISVWNNDDS